jgi:hypothetical protein
VNSSTAAGRLSSSRPAGEKIAPSANPILSSVLNALNVGQQPAPKHISYNDLASGLNDDERFLIEITDMELAEELMVRRQLLPPMPLDLPQGEISLATPRVVSNAGNRFGVIVIQLFELRFCIPTKLSTGSLFIFLLFCALFVTFELRFSVS